MTTSFELGDKQFHLTLPEGTTCLKMTGAPRLEHPALALREALDRPIGSDPFPLMVKKKLAGNPEAEAVIVISDNTRPVPYRGEQGILLPLVRDLVDAGMAADKITVLCANGTHVPLHEQEFRRMIDPELFELGLRVINHDCLDSENLKFLGHSESGTKIEINRIYCDASIKILTGLVESHFMAGVSGGRKSICPGLIGEDSTFVFHGVENLDHRASADLILEGNPCHREALEVARSIGCDFMVNVTLDHEYNVTGYFAGDMEEAHLAAYERVKASVGIPDSGPYDIVVAHAGYVGKNHYQAAKTGTAALPLLREDSVLILAGDCTDSDPVGKESYRSVLPYLKGKSSEEFIALLRSPDWKFVPDQWQVQMWARLFKVIPQKGLLYYAPQIMESDYAILPGVNGNDFLPEDRRYGADDRNIPLFLERALASTLERMKAEGRRNIRIAWLADGPYGIVI